MFMFSYFTLMATKRTSIANKVKLLNLNTDKNAHFRRNFQTAQHGFCILKFSYAVFA